MALAILTAVAGFSCAYFVLRADLARRRLRIDAHTVFFWPVVAGFAGIAVFRMLENAAGLSGQASGGLFQITALSRSGGALAGMLAFFFLARRYHMRLLVLFDLVGPAATLGISAARLVSLLFVLLARGAHEAVDEGAVPAAAIPAWTTIVLAGTAIFYFLWREGRRAIQFQRPEGIVFSEFLVTTGLLGFGVGFWNPGGRVAAGLTSTQITSLAWAVAGGGLLAVVLRRYFSEREEHRIIQHVAEEGEATQPEYTPPTPECPHPERWQMLDSMTAEVEVMDFLKSLVITVKPELIVETGTFMGLSAIKMAEGLKANGFGKIVTCEFDPVVFAKAKQRIGASGLAEWIECRNESSLEARVEGMIDIFFSDSHIPIREQEIRRFLPQISPHGLVLAHDASSHYKTVREAALRLEKEGLLSVVLLSTPRGLVVAQKRAGRT
jgi:predicted O-methyltransferase YrrM